jgi:hypothetical protein
MKSEVDQHGLGQPLTGRVIHAVERVGRSTPSSDSEKRCVSHEASWDGRTRAIGYVYRLTVPRSRDCFALPTLGSCIFTRTIRSSGDGLIPGHRTK